MKIGIVGNISKPQAIPVINRFVSLLTVRGIPFVFADSLRRFLNLNTSVKTAAMNEMSQTCSIIVAFGGDGTMLSTAREIGAAAVPLLGVNIGTLGFLTEVVVDELEEMVENLSNGRYAVIERMLLRLDIIRDYLSKTYYALNDIVVDKGLVSRLIYIDAKVNGTFLNSYRADGLIVATPTGSTAYSLSAGGPLMMPNMHAFIIAPICPHSLSVRPIVLSDDSRIELSIRKEAEPVQVNIDGQNFYSLLSKETLRIAKAEFNVRWITMGKRDFFHVLRTKLHWGSNGRNSTVPAIKKNRYIR